VPDVDSTYRPAAPGSGRSLDRAIQPLSVGYADWPTPAAPGRIESFRGDTEAAGRARVTIARRLCTSPGSAGTWSSWRDRPA